MIGPIRSRISVDGKAGGRLRSLHARRDRPRIDLRDRSGAYVRSLQVSRSL